MLAELREDYNAYRMSPMRLLKGLLTLSTFWLVAIYRFGHWAYRKRIPLVPSICRAIGMIFYAADISPAARIGPGFRVAHSVGIVIGPDVVAGKNFEVFSNVTLGGRDRVTNGRTMPKFGDNVTVFAGAAVLGPIYIGDNVSIGANAVVIKDVPPNVIVAGNPARIVGQVSQPHSLRSMGK